MFSPNRQLEKKGYHTKRPIFVDNFDFFVFLMAGIGGGGANHSSNPRVCSQDDVFAKDHFFMICTEQHC